MNASAWQSFKLPPSTDECIIAPGKTSKANQYPRTRINGKSTRIYRYLFEKEHGPIPKGMTIDHLCFNLRCVNIRHLEMVSHAENARRYWDRLQPQRTTGRVRGLCIKGHDLTDAWVSREGKKFCRKCHKRRSKEYVDRQKLRHFRSFVQPVTDGS
jgi:hypothetical protein